MNNKKKEIEKEKKTSKILAVTSQKVARTNTLLSLQHGNAGS